MILADVDPVSWLRSVLETQRDVRECIVDMPPNTSDLVVKTTSGAEIVVRVNPGELNHPTDDW